MWESVIYALAALAYIAVGAFVILGILAFIKYLRKKRILQIHMIKAGAADPFSGQLLRLIFCYKVSPLGSWFHRR